MTLLSLRPDQGCGPVDGALSEEMGLLARAIRGLEPGGVLRRQQHLPGLLDLPDCDAAPAAVGRLP